jgi:hypothetical protein
MTKKMTKDMIHETLESGGGITQAKWHDQELIITRMSSKGNLGNVFFFHTYLVVARTEIKFSKVLSTTLFIQEIINDRNGKFFFDGEFVEDVKVWTHAPSSFFLEYHNYRRRIGVGTRTDNTHVEQFLNDFLNFILRRKGIIIRLNIGRKIVRDKRNGMIMNTMGRGKSMGSGKNSLVFGYDRLEVMMHGGCLNCLNGMELGNNARMTFFEEFFHSMGTDDLKGA